LIPDSAASTATLIASDHPSKGWRRVLRWLRAFAKWLTILYAVALVVLLPALEWWGERNWLLSLLLYAPAQLLLAPLVFLTPFCLLVLRPRWIVLHLACAAAVGLVYMTYRSTGVSSASSIGLRVITHNVGQGSWEQFAAFSRRHTPDLILLQDIRSEGPKYARLYPGMHTMTRGEFCIFSRLPIRTADVVVRPVWRGRVIAARFEIADANRPFAVYNVHLPTPRSQFNRFLSKRVMTDLVGDEDRAGGFASYREWINARRELAQELENVFAKEKLPFLACGDFNTPDHGFIYHLFARRMTDAHAKAGHGYGMTFPCDVKPVANRLGPWLRIDYAFVGPGWKPVYCETDNGTRSQHRAVMVHLEADSSR
jgi:endonuclease/exonuclease/phosphatase family metal-dependent hydrolase